MLATLGYGSLDDLAAAAVPDAIKATEGLELAPASETEVLAALRDLAGRNRVMTSMIGLGYHDTITPPVLRRNILENPAWYTAYTPYQPEISQGRLEALLNFQTMVADLTGLDIASASLLDEATAAAEAMALCRRSSKAPDGAVFVIDADCHPQTIAVVETRAEPLGLPVVVSDTLPDGDIFGVLVQYPGSSGLVRDWTDTIAEAHSRGALVAVATDPLALCLLTPPGSMGADIAVGSAQRFGVPMGFGGPHAGFMAVREGLQRSLPGRLVGVSIDADGAQAYRLALQTREQHIRREKATSNICTAQVLLAVMASMYAVYHGPDGLAAIAGRVHEHARNVSALGDPVHAEFFDTVQLRVPGRAAALVHDAAERGLNIRAVNDDVVAIACDEATTAADIDTLREIIGNASGEPGAIPWSLRRTESFLTHPVFHEHRSETAMLRYLRRLADKDVALDRSMIPLGSCTMKLNATAEMEPITWPGFASIHPFAPLDQAAGYLELIRDLERWLCE